MCGQFVPEVLQKKLAPMQGYMKITVLCVTGTMCEENVLEYHEMEMASVWIESTLSHVTVLPVYLM